MLEKTIKMKYNLNHNNDFVLLLFNGNEFKNSTEDRINYLKELNSKFVLLDEEYQKNPLLLFKYFDKNIMQKDILLLIHYSAWPTVEDFFCKLDEYHKKHLFIAIFSGGGIGKLDYDRIMNKAEAVNYRNNVFILLKNFPDNINNKLLKYFFDVFVEEHNCESISNKLNEIINELNKPEYSEDSEYIFALAILCQGYLAAHYDENDLPKGDFYNAINNMKWISFINEKGNSNFRNLIDNRKNDTENIENYWKSVLGEMEEVEINLKKMSKCNIPDSISNLLLEIYSGKEKLENIDIVAKAYLRIEKLLA